MPRNRKHDSDQPGPGDVGVSLSELGLTGHTVSRRSMLKAGAGVVAGAGLASVAGGFAAQPAYAGLNKLARANATRVPNSLLGSQLTGETQTQGLTGVSYTDLCIPVERADGTLLFIGGDSYSNNGNPGDINNDWRSPIALISNRTDENQRAVVTGSVTDRQNHAKGLVPQDHRAINFGKKPDGSDDIGYTTTLPTDAFRVGNTLYLHLVRGVYGRTQEKSEFWRSTDGGQTWQYLRSWFGNEWGGQFNQKSYAVADDAYVYCMTTAFQRETRSGLLLFRVLKSDLNKTDADANASGYLGRYAYQAWGYKNGAWAWGNEPTTIIEERTWGEICFRAMGGKYVLSWLQTNPPSPNYSDLRAMVFPLPTSNLVQTTEQTMVYFSEVNPSSGGAGSSSVQKFPYAPFIFPRSTFANFNFVVSNWDQPSNVYGPNAHNYCVSQWKTSLNPNI